MSNRIAALVLAAAGTVSALAITAAAVDDPPSRPVTPAAAVSHLPDTAPKPETTPKSPAAKAEARPRGYDVSHYDRGVQWDKTDRAFGIAKATEGTNIVDETFAKHWAELADAGKVRGAYHFARPNGDPVEQADYFLKAVNREGLRAGDLLALDLEVSGGRSGAELNRWAKAWLDRVEEKTGVKAFVYSSWYFARDMGEGLGEYPLWVAHYGKPAGELKPPAPWKDWTIHQYASTDHDQNISRLNADELRELGYRPAS
ncbi:glycoside hydrolase family 25 protein [Actinocorallia lasiicapitis]